MSKRKWRFNAFLPFYFVICDGTFCSPISLNLFSKIGNFKEINEIDLRLTKTNLKPML